MKKTAVLGMYLAFAMILSYIEVLIPLPIPIPGIKLGLANLAIILILYLYGFKEALLINVVRIIRQISYMNPKIQFQNVSAEV